MSALLLIPFRAGEAQAGDELIRLQREARSGYDGAYVRADGDFARAAVARVRSAGGRNLAAFFHAKIHTIDVERAAPVKTWLAGLTVPQGVELSPLSDEQVLIAVFDRIAALPDAICKDGACVMSLIGASLTDLTLVVHDPDTGLGQIVVADIRGAVKSLPLMLEADADADKVRGAALSRLDPDRLSRLEVSTAESVAVGRRAMVTCSGDGLRIEHFDAWKKTADIVLGRTMDVVSVQLAGKIGPALTCDVSSFGAVALSPPLGRALAENRRVDPWLFLMVRKT